MCGIVGSINSKINIEYALAKIKHRGPDAHGIFENNFIQFGHVRLSIIDLSSGSNQPFKNVQTGSSLIFNGEIYNYKQLKDSFKHEFDFKTESDTEVLFYGLQKNGIDFIHELQGMFAFAYHDAVNNFTYLVRDRFGIKPLYFKKVGSGLIFSSEIKAIRPSKFSSSIINKERLSDFIYNRRLDHTNQTFYLGIEQLPAGFYLKFDHMTEKASLINYYEIPCFGSGNKKFDPDELRERIIDTVNSHIQADVPVGSFLSGGIDSSIISHVLSNLKKDNISTISGRTIYEHSENKLIDTFLNDHPNIKSIQFELDGSQFFEEIFNVIYHHDEPILDGSMFSHFMLCKKASENGIKVVLSGSGADEIFGGYESHSIGILTDQLTKFKLKKFLSCFRNYCEFHQQKRSWVTLKIFSEIIGQKLKNRLKKIKYYNNYLTLSIPDEQFRTKCNSYLGSAFEGSLRFQTIPPYLHYEDRNSMAFGVEIRVPYLDHHLISYVSELNQIEIFDGTRKNTLRNSFNKVISKEILFQRRKEGFPSPIDTALRKDLQLKSFFYAKLTNTPFLNEKKCRQLANEFYTKGKKLTQFWRILSYMIWFDINNKD